MLASIDPAAEAAPLPAPRHVAARHGRIAYRESGAGPPLVLLHGIGSSSGSWAAQLGGLASTRRVIAWDAPGYGESAPLPGVQPPAEAYADALDQLLGALGIERLVLVGHSLGAIVAAAWSARHAARLEALVLASPARGYGSAAAAERDAKLRDRLELLDRDGIDGIAASRAARLCAPGASSAIVERIRRNMAEATPAGYRQAAHLLAGSDLLRWLPLAATRVAVMCGELDAVTPPAACRAIAESAGAPFELLPGVGHACYVEDPAGFAAALRRAIAGEGGHRSGGPDVR